MAAECKDQHGTRSGVGIAVDGPGFLNKRINDAVNECFGLNGQILDAGNWMPDTGYWMLVSRCWIERKSYSVCEY